MAAKWTFLLFALILSLFNVQTLKLCSMGFSLKGQECDDINECSNKGLCGLNSNCINTNGSYYCQCKDGFRSSSKTVNFTVLDSARCKDINECLDFKDVCGPNAMCNNVASNYTCTCKEGFVSSTGVKIFHGRDNITCGDKDECKEENTCGLNASCINTQGSYYCICKAGFGRKSGNPSFTGKEEQCEDKCNIDETICGNGTCHHEASGHYCACFAGFTNYGNKTARCTKLDCGIFRDENNLIKNFHTIQDHMKKFRESCLNLSKSGDTKELNEEGLIKSLLSVTDQVLFTGFLNNNRKVSTFLNLVEQALRFIGPFIKTPGTKRSNRQTELELLVHTGSAIPQGLKTLSSKHAKLDIKLEEAAEDPSFYLGFTTVSLLTYLNLEEYADGFFHGMKKNENESFKINSKVVTVSVSNRDTKHLKEPINITLFHLDQLNQTSHTCVSWDFSKDGGAWSAGDCSMMDSETKHTMCSCNHLGSFAVLVALNETEGHFELQLISWVGLSLSLICLFFCILTFSMIRSIKSPRTTIHLHLCISLFTATLIFLTGISQTENKIGCAVVAVMLYFFYLATFCWMCLEGIQLFRMVVFNTSFRTIYMVAWGYGVPAVIVTITTFFIDHGYGRKKYCWLNLDYIWSFFGPTCVCIIVNTSFFLKTVWKLAQKFSSLNPDLDSLHKIKAFAVSLVAQLCILRCCTMWIFSSFQLERGTATMSYLFTIFSLQGIVLFIMHCLFSKQVRDEYGSIFSRFCPARKRTCSHFSLTAVVPSSSVEQS